MRPTGPPTLPPISPPAEPPSLSGPGERGGGLAALMVATPQRTLALCIGSIAAMLPWPLLGILLMHSLFDRPSEAVFFFGGITLFPLMILALFGTFAEEVYIAVFMVVWLAAAVVPGLWLRRRLRSRRGIGVLLGVQSVFALAQALMGAMLIVGKSV